MAQAGVARSRVGVARAATRSLARGCVVPDTVTAMVSARSGRQYFLNLFDQPSCCFDVVPYLGLVEPDGQCVRVGEGENAPAEVWIKNAEPAGQQAHEQTRERLRAPAGFALSLSQGLAPSLAPGLAQRPALVEDA